MQGVYTFDDANFLMILDDANTEFSNDAFAGKAPPEVPISVLDKASWSRVLIAFCSCR